MSGSVSPLPWTGNKGCIYTTIDAFMPPHRTYVEACMGSAEVFLRKKPVEKEIINDYNGDLVRLFRVLQRNENLERLIGRLFLSFNSEQIFRANKALLAEVPNILDDLTETSVIIENTQWNDFDLAVAFYENQVFSFSSTGKNFAITKKDMTKRFGRLIAACARLRNATIMHRDYKDCISYLAKVAMDITAKKMPADENGVRIAELDEMSYRRELWTHRPLTDFWMVGRGISKKLEDNYMFTMGDVARCSQYNEAKLYKLFGVNAELLIDRAWGREPTTIADVKAYRPSSNSLSMGQVLHKPYTLPKSITHSISTPG